MVARDEVQETCLPLVVDVIRHREEVLDHANPAEYVTEKPFIRVHLVRRVDRVQTGLADVVEQCPGDEQVAIDGAGIQRGGRVADARDVDAVLQQPLAVGAVVLGAGG